jgi:hypothetical protein
MWIAKKVKVKAAIEESNGMQLPWCAFVSLWRLITHSYPPLLKN